MSQLLFDTVVLKSLLLRLSTLSKPLIQFTMYMMFSNKDRHIVEKLQQQI